MIHHQTAKRKPSRLRGRERLRGGEGEKMRGGEEEKRRRGD